MTTDRNDGTRSGNGPAMWPLAFAQTAMGADLLPGGDDAGSATLDVGSLHFAGAATDNRTVQPGALFFAIEGERVDGFDFAGAAVRTGAAAVVVPRGRGRPPGCETARVLVVDDTVAALGSLARAVRDRFAGRVIGVTGSNGKTTTKELIAAALAPAGLVMRTPGNLNTEIGLPLTVLSASGREAFWVLEMAMRGPGEIAHLAGLALPHVALVTNVAAAHVGRLGSLAAVAAAKGEIFSRLNEPGVAGRAVLPADEPLLDPFVASVPAARVVRFAGGKISADRPDPIARVLDVVACGASGSRVRAVVANQPWVFDLPLAGRHNATNAAAALAVVHALGLPIAPAAAALAQVQLPPHRSHPIDLQGRIILDDCYNANPASMQAALHTMISSTGGRAFAILGDMLELGDESEHAHIQLGTLAAQSGLYALGTVGALGRHIAEGARRHGLPAERIVHDDDPVRVVQALAPHTRPGDWILIKASRGARLERALAAFESLWGPAPDPAGVTGNPGT